MFGTFANLQRSFHHISQPLLLTISLPILSLGALFALVCIYTTARYKHTVSHYTHPKATKHDQCKTPPRIPYTIPFLGHSISFLTRTPGLFWRRLFSSDILGLTRSGACTLLLGGRDIHILYAPTAVQSLFKSRSLGRDEFNLQVVQQGLGVEKAEAQLFYGFDEPEDKATGLTPLQRNERIFHKYLADRRSVDELVVRYLAELKKQMKEGREDLEVDLGKWVQGKMFVASTATVMGRRVLEVSPNVQGDFFDYDRDVLTMFFGIPRWLRPEPYRARDRALRGLIKWQEHAQKESSDEPVDPDGDVDWEPILGSRVNRARQQYYTSRGLKTKTRAALDLGFIFGLSSNSIPAAAWMLLHILDPKGDTTLRPRIMDELALAQHSDGTLDVPALLSSPLLQSTLHEVLRLYMDFLITREIDSDVTLPINSDTQVRLKKDSAAMVPSWLGHRDAMHWTNPPSDVFYAERFLIKGKDTGKQDFSTEGTQGKFFPFGGGRAMCPGRIFAKQEVLVSVATVLLAYEIEVVGFVDEMGKKMEEFPRLRDTFNGIGILGTDDDLRVKMKRRDPVHSSNSHKR